MANFLENSHRMFIQAMMWKKFCSVDEVRRLHRVCHEKNGTQPADLKVFVEKINVTINANNMAIKKGKDELSGEDYYVLINTADNELSRLSSEYKPKELELFKRIIICIVESDEGTVSSSAILNLADEVKISKREADETVTKFAKDGWLVEEKKGSVFFSTRAIVELQHFFLTNYSESISQCIMCKNIVFQGVNCKSCEKKIHHHCKESYFSQLKGSSTCPSCNESFE